MPSYPSSPQFPTVPVSSANDPDVEQALAVAQAQEGDYSETELAALNRYVRGCKADKIWDRQYEVYPFCGTNLKAALVKLKSAPDNATSLVNHGFVEADYNYLDPGTNQIVHGLKGNGSSKYLDTGIGTMRLRPHTGFSFYLLEALPSGTDYSYMGYRHSSSQFFILGRYGTGAYDGCFFGSDTLPCKRANGVNQAGLHSLKHNVTGGITAPNIRILTYWHNGVRPADAAHVNSYTSTAAYSSSSVFLFADRSHVNSPTKFLNGRGGFAALLLQLTDAEYLLFYKRVQQLMYELGRSATPGNPVNTSAATSYPAAPTYAS